MKQKNVLISGAGIAGPVLAWWLVRYGFRPVIIERWPQLRSGGQNIDISGAAQEIVAKMGLEKDIKAANTGEQGLRFVDHKYKIKAQFPVGKSKNSRGTKELEILRGDLAGILYNNTCQDIEYIFGDEITNIHDDGNKAIVSFLKRADQEFDIVVAADGVRSKTRTLIFGDDAKLRPLGIYCAYFTIPRAETDDKWWNWYHALGSRSIFLRPDNAGTTRASLWFLSKPAGYESLSLNEQKDILVKKYLNAGWETQRILEGLRNTNELYFDYICQVHMPQWRKGRAILVGDAAYGPSPLSGLGTTLAFVGAYLLAGELSRHEDYTKSFFAYEELMRPYVNLAQKLPPGVPRIAHPKTRFGIYILHVIAKIASSEILARRDNGLGRSSADSINLPDYSLKDDNIKNN
jgi:2-polyprenyl-6-methoxyphenol hydroxylase-like FAD-dependent oxidoreductase